MTVEGVAAACAGGAWEGLERTRLVELLRQMVTIRAFEEMAEQLYALGKVHGTMHLSIGMEASAVGAIAALRPDDLILSTHRGHGHLSLIHI